MAAREIISLFFHRPDHFYPPVDVTIYIFAENIFLSQICNFQTATDTFSQLL